LKLPIGYPEAAFIDDIRESTELEQPLTKPKRWALTHGF